MTTMRRRIRTHAGRRIQALGRATGAMNLVARMRGLEGGVILMYHSVADGEARRFVDPRNHVPAEVFAQQMAFLASRRRVVPLADLVECLRRGEAPPQGAVAITFDDGYLDTRTVAAPILARHRLPATVFLPTGYIDRAEPQWVDQAHAAFTFRDRHRLVWSTRDGGQTFDLGSKQAAPLAYRTVCADLLTAAPEARRALLEHLVEQLRPVRACPKLTMSWSDVERLVAAHPGVALGGHTIEHVDLTAVEHDRAVRELSGARGATDGRFGAEPRAFSFPYGRATARLRESVREAGYDASCGGGRGAVVMRETDPFALPRVEAPPTMNGFDLLTSSVNSNFWRRLAG